MNRKERRRETNNIHTRILSVKWRVEISHRILYFTRYTTRIYVRWRLPPMNVQPASPGQESDVHCCFSCARKGLTGLWLIGPNASWQPRQDVHAVAATHTSNQRRGYQIPRPLAYKMFSLRKPIICKTPCRTVHCVCACVLRLCRIENKTNTETFRQRHHIFGEVY